MPRLDATIGKKKKTDDARVQMNIGKESRVENCHRRKAGLDTGPGQRKNNSRSISLKTTNTET